MTTQAGRPTHRDCNAHRCRRPAILLTKYLQTKEREPCRDKVPRCPSARLRQARPYVAGHPLPPDTRGTRPLPAGAPEPGTHTRILAYSHTHILAGRRRPTHAPNRRRVPITCTSGCSNDQPGQWPGTSAMVEHTPCPYRGRPALPEPILSARPRTPATPMPRARTDNAPASS
jgi:hypothetical protein